MNIKTYRLSLLRKQSEREKLKQGWSLWRPCYRLLIGVSLSLLASASVYWHKIRNYTYICINAQNINGLSKNWKCGCGPLIIYTLYTHGIKWWSGKEKKQPEQETGIWPLWSSRFFFSKFKTRSLASCAPLVLAYNTKLVITPPCGGRFNRWPGWTLECTENYRMR